MTRAREQTGTRSTPSLDLSGLYLNILGFANRETIDCLVVGFCNNIMGYEPVPCLRMIIYSSHAQLISSIHIACLSLLVRIAIVFRKMKVP